MSTDPNRDAPSDDIPEWADAYYDWIAQFVKYYGWFIHLAGGVALMALLSSVVTKDSLAAHLGFVVLFGLATGCATHLFFQRCKAWGIEPQPSSNRFRLARLRPQRRTARQPANSTEQRSSSPAAVGPTGNRRRQPPTSHAPVIDLDDDFDDEDIDNDDFEEALAGSWHAAGSPDLRFTPSPVQQPSGTFFGDLSSATGIDNNDADDPSSGPPTRATWNLVPPSARQTPAPAPTDDDTATGAQTATVRFVIGYGDMD